jgi:hypothetical protein
MENKMNIHQKINAKGNSDVFYPSSARLGKIRLIKRNYGYPYQDKYLPDRLYIKLHVNQIA